MPFVLAPNALLNLDFLRDKYQNEKSINLNEPKPILSAPVMFGGTDVETRRAQIEFLEKMHLLLKAHFIKGEDISTHEDLQTSVTSSRIMLAAIVYVRSQISSSKRRSVLYRLLEDDLGISQYNDLDQEDEEICILAAKRYVTHSISVFDQANAVLRKANHSPLNPLEWDHFNTFLCERSNKIPDSRYSSYPITKISQRFFGAAGAYTGATVGMLAGDVLSHSSYSSSNKMKLTAMVGTSMVVFGSAGSAGVALFAPVVAERLLSAFCSISLAHILGVSMEFLGQGVGVSVGLPLDLACALICYACKTISSYTFNTQTPLLTGIRVSDGTLVFNGIAIKPMPEDQVPADCQTITIDMRDGRLYINDQEVTASETTLPAEFIERLETKLRMSSLLEPVTEVHYRHDEAEAKTTPALI